MFCNPQAGACSMATIVLAAPSEGGGGNTLKEAVVGASCRACGGGSMFFFKEKGDGMHTGMSLSGLLSGLEGGHLVGDALL
jgi:hypothetical protein